MVFSSLTFLFRFLPLVLVIYFLVPKKARTGRNLVLLLFSLVFYAWGEPRYIVLVIGSTLVDYTMGRIIAYSRKTDRPKLAKASLICSLVVNLSLLGIFKYADFAIGIVDTITPLHLKLLNLALPIGISFYTFQTLSYTIDVYRGIVDAQRNIISFGAYVTSFPQLVAGPIVRYETVAKELSSRNESWDNFAEGVRRFAIGLGKKVLIANQVGAVWSEIAATPTDEMTTLTAWLGVAMFTLQIYFDFSGYSDMAIGLGRMFGFHFMENFEHPYESKSITEFWRRWHISLGSWFREYVYIPLGGNRRGLAIQCRNLFIVWFLTGLWHGASWNFVIWGLYYGVLLMIEKLWLKKILEKLPAAVGHIYTIILVMFGWAIFSFDDMADGMGYIGTLFGFSGSGLCDSTTAYLFLTNLVLILIAAVGSTSLFQSLWNRIRTAAWRRTDLTGRGGSAVAVSAAEWVLVLGVMLLAVAFLINSSYNPFLYFRF